MADVTPVQLLGASYSANSTSITIALADLLPAGELTAAEANATTGNGSKVAFALIKTISEKYAALASADQPTRMTSYEGSYNTNADDTVTRTYTQSFQFAVGDVADEPDVSSPSSSSSVSSSSSAS